MADNWIQGAIKKPGAFTAQAQRAGETTQAFAADVRKSPEDYTERTQKRAALARTLSRMNKETQ